MNNSVATATHRGFVPPPPPKTAKAAGTRRLLLDIAADLFLDRGFDAVSIQDIASAAKLTKGAVYGHFNSKGQLLVEVMRWKLAERDHSPGFAERVSDPERGVELLYDESGRDIRLLEVDVAAAARHDPEVAAGWALLIEERNARIRASMEHATDPDTAAWLVGVLTAGIGAKESSGLPQPSAERLHAAMLAVIRALA